MGQSTREWTSLACNFGRYFQRLLGNVLYDLQLCIKLALGYTLTSEVVEPWTCFPSPLPLQAVWIVTAILMNPYSAPVLGIGAPVQVTPRISCSRPSTLSTLCIFTSELKITGSGVVGALPWGTERGPERRALPRTAGSLAASYHLKGVVLEAAGDLARVVGICESIVKEIHWGSRHGVPWTLLFGIFKTKHISLKVGWSCVPSVHIGTWYQLGIPLEMEILCCLIISYILFHEWLDHFGVCWAIFKMLLKIYKNKLAKWLNSNQTILIVTPQTYLPHSHVSENIYPVEICQFIICLLLFTFYCWALHCCCLSNGSHGWCLSRHRACCGLGCRADQVALVQWNCCVHLRIWQSWIWVKDNIHGYGLKICCGGREAPRKKNVCSTRILPKWVVGVLQWI